MLGPFGVSKWLGPLAFSALVGLSHGHAETVRMDLGEARALGQKAFATGNYALAHQIGQGLLRANPEDPTALLLVAASAPQVGKAEEGLDAGKRAFKSVDTPELRFQSAYLTARAAAADERFLSSQYWLRRAYQAAHTPAQEKLAATSFKRLRSLSPYSSRFSFSATPSSNLNGGSSEERLFIDGVGHGGQFTGAARALSGIRYSLTSNLSYRFSESKDHATSFTFRSYRSFNQLSNEAKELSPESEGSDFDYALVELGVRHRVRPTTDYLPDTYSIAFGQTWYGEDAYERVLRLGTGRTFKLDDTSTLRVTGELENRASARGAADRLGRHLKFSYGKELENKNYLTFGLDLKRVTSDWENNEYDSASVSVGYSMGEAVAGMRLSGQLRLRHSDFETYSVGGIDSGGRQDTELDGTVNLHIDEVSYMGFRPILSLNASRTTSNVSRFEGRNLGLSVGFQSAF